MTEPARAPAKPADRFDLKGSNRWWGDRTPPKSKAEFFNAVTTPAPSGDGTIATIRLYGPIDSWGGYWGISTKDVGQVLDQLPDSVSQIILRVNSPGGEVFEGVSILNMLRAHKASVTAVVDGLAASAASFIAAGCDETVMSPGTQMMIHSPWSIALGSATEMRKTADVLDGIEASIVEIYTAKAGAKDWTALLAEETWLTAAAAVELGLVDRVAVIKDAGETDTVGEDEELLLVDPDGDFDDATTLRFAASARATQTPVSTEPGNPNRKEPTMGTTPQAGSEQLGATESASTEQTPVVATVAEPTATTITVDAAAFAQLQSDAAAGRAARDQQNTDRRASIADAAVADGRIAPASRDSWVALLAANEEGTVTVLDSLQKNTIPVTEIGHSDTTKALTADDQLMAAAGWATDDSKGA
jgi:ATP-dependent protease ClpP protease subunit